jgi:glucose/arabinose dehydrogenase
MHKFNTHFHKIKQIPFILLISFYNSNSISADSYLDKLIIPDGFEISIYAENLDSPRQLTETDKGYVVAGSKKGDKIYAFLDSNSDGYAEKRILVAENLQNPTGVTFHNGDLYFAEIDTIWVIRDIDNWLSSNSSVLPRKSIYMNNLPSETWHGFKYIDFGPDGNMYIPVGVPCNICLEPQTSDKRFAAIHKYVDGELITVADGVRNSVGFDWHPLTGKLYFSDNGRDWLGDDSPSCELNVVDTEGSFYGYPFKHARDVIDPEFGHMLSSFERDLVDPIAELGPHVAPLGIAFYDKENFPAKYKNSVFVALHGSWNRTKKSGYTLVFIKLDDDGNYLYQEDFISGWLSNESAWGRPVSPYIMRDGSMLLSDDKYNVIYRVSYKG